MKDFPGLSTARPSGTSQDWASEQATLTEHHSPVSTFRAHIGPKEDCGHRGAGRKGSAIGPLYFGMGVGLVASIAAVVAFGVSAWGALAIYSFIGFAATWVYAWRVYRSAE